MLKLILSNMNSQISLIKVQTARPNRQPSPVGKRVIYASNVTKMFQSAFETKHRGGVQSN